MKAELFTECICVKTRSPKREMNVAWPKQYRVSLATEAHGRSASCFHCELHSGVVDKTPELLNAHALKTIALSNCTTKIFKFLSLDPKP